MNFINYHDNSFEYLTDNMQKDIIKKFKDKKFICLDCGNKFDYLIAKYRNRRDGLKEICCNKCYSGFQKTINI